MRGIEKPVVHVDVYHHGPVSHLLARNGYRLVIAFVLNEPQKLARACHVATLTHIDKARAAGPLEALKTAETHV